ncbi:MAG: glycosyltransferase family 2 protein [Actinomycetota bacterium]|nr:glycosyltransferase family 2 protein [Actinomycetota bacterium]
MIQVIYAVLLTYFLVLNLGTIALVLSALRENRLRQRQARYTNLERLIRSNATIAVSVIVPAYNEETVIRDTVLSVLGSRHLQFEVIVVNDGSTDRTLEVLSESFGLELRDAFYPQPIATARVRNVYRSRIHPTLTVVDKGNGGKADACNAGVNIAYYPYIVHTDADCIFEPETLIRSVRAVNFDPRRIVGVGGQLRPSNGLEVRDGRILSSRLPSSLVARFQVVEYMSAFTTHRLAWSRLNAVPVVSGGFGLWRKDVVVDLGGYATDVTHEDIELTIHAHRQFRRGRIPYSITLMPDATIWTQVPASWNDIRTQRKRWQRIVLEVLWKYKTMIFNPRYGLVGILTMPYLLLYEGLGPLVEAFAYGFVAVVAVLGVLNVQYLILFLAFSFGLNAAIRLAAVLMDVLFFETYDRRSVVHLCLLTLLEPVVYRPLLLGPRLYAFYEFLTGHKVHEKLTRQPSTTAPRQPSG